MPTDPLAVVNRQFQDIINANRPDLAEEVFHPQLIVERAGIQNTVRYLAGRNPSPVGGPGGPGGPAGPPTDPIEGFKFGQSTIAAAFPDMRVEVVSQVVQGDQVVSRVRVTGTHEGDFFGLPATHRKVEFDEVLFMTVTEGKVSRVWGLGDDFAFLEQLGVLPGPENPSRPAALGDEGAPA
ncbi:ester cyclase [Streptomyces sp. NPDC096311]|uniref:ester cyclase n=1 Tax=Streptomyces sp. NPDC096311 TaxID=3366083 RepID=UPI0037FC57AA